MGVMMGVRDEDTVSSLAGRLARLNNQLDHNDQQRIKEKSGGTALADIVGGLLAAIDPDRIDDKAREISGIPAGTEPGDQARQTARDQLVGIASRVFNGELIELLDSIRREKEQTIDHDNLDTVLRAEWEGDAAGQCQAGSEGFS